MTTSSRVLFVSAALSVSASAAAAAEGDKPATAVAALDRANAAYEFGDLNQVVEAARTIVDGAVPADERERSLALRLLGIALYLTGRADGAEVAFVALLRLRPSARLDPATTRPEVVAFFEQFRRRHARELEEVARRSRPSRAWAFLPPAGQFKNGDRGRGFVILGLGVASLAGAVATAVVLDSRCGEDRVCRDGGGELASDSSRTLRTFNHVSVAVLAATYVAGVIDALLRSGREPEERASISFVLLPGYGGLRARF